MKQFDCEKSASAGVQRIDCYCFKKKNYSHRFIYRLSVRRAMFQPRLNLFWRIHAKSLSFIGEFSKFQYYSENECIFQLVNINERRCEWEGEDFIVVAASG